ncbi:MAG TPA: hypothetical protein VF748_16065 [Candidatus Acidoferrum sp.]
MKQYWLGVCVHCHHKGGNSQQEMNRANQLSQQQLALQQQQFGLQQQQLGMVNPVLQQIIANGGMLPAQEAAMRSAAMNQIGAGENQAIGSINQSLLARGITGGGMAGSGDIARNYGSLMQGLLGQEAQGLQNIQLAKGQGLGGALNTALGEGGMYGSQAVSLGGQGVNALGIGQQAANAADQASTGFWGSLIGGLAGIGSSAITKCWVAAELYGGWFSPEVGILQQFIFETGWLKPFAWLYIQFGERWAEWIHDRHPLARRYTKKLFDWFLKNARG